MTQPLIAVVGASNNPEKYGHLIFRDLLKAGYKVVPIHPTESTILEIPAVKNLQVMKEVPTIVITIIPPAVTEKIVQEIIEAHLPIKEIWMQPGSESQAAASKAAQYQITVHQACFMKAQGLW